MTRMRLTNLINPGLVVGGPPRQRTYCSTSWDLETQLPTTEIIFTRPVGDASAITGESFVDPGEFSNGSNVPQIRFRGLVQIQHRDLQFDVPYFDSAVGLEIAAGDSWDRRKQLTPMARVQPRIEYEGSCIPVGSATCNSNLGTDGRGTVAIALDQMIGWQADPFAARGGGNIVLLMQDPAKSLFEADVDIGPAFPTGDGDWAAEVTSNLTQAEYDRFVGGTLTVDGLTARVKAFAPRSPGRVLCTFEVIIKCAGTTLYLVPGGAAAAHLREDPNADRLWINLNKDIPILSTGQPAKFTEEPKLPLLDHSMTLKFATRLVVQFKGQSYFGPISTPIPAPYIHPAPQPPRTCFVIDQLATDYYGRAILRVHADRCPPLDRQFAMRVTMAPGGDLTKEDYLAGRSQGLFGVQAIFERQRLFEAFDALRPSTRSERLHCRHSLCSRSGRSRE